MQTENESLLKKWVQEHSDILYGYTVQRGFDTEMAKDMVQETFLAAWRNIDNYKGEASPKNWLFIILKSKITDHYRKGANKVMVEAIAKEHDDHTFFDTEDHWDRNAYPQSWSVNFENKVEIKEFYTVFKKCGSKLKQVQNSVFVMKYMDGMESDEICKVLNISPSNYWVLIHRAKVQLRACLQKNWGNN